MSLASTLPILRFITPFMMKCTDPDLRLPRAARRLAPGVE
ncbi:hypothetical protein C7S14_3974 [Burkholderia cepacia]|nr:hypothetical protein C7S14_3974 [Burkholderia cepacia]